MTVQSIIRTETYDDTAATWEDIRQEIQTLDSPQRGTTPRSTAFLTLWFAHNGTDEEFM